MASSKRVCVIGAGLAGLGSITSCLEEGLEPFCYELQDEVGGLWRYTEEDIDGRGCVMKSTIINTSKEMSSISNFTFPPEYPNYMHNTLMFETILNLWKELGLRKFVRFRHKVLKVSPADDYARSGKWVARIRDLESAEDRDEEFGAVMVCTGHHAFPMMPPPFQGQEKFEGRIIHSHSYKTNRGFEGRSVVVVGAGNSAVDAVVDVSHVNTKTYLSTRTGLWLTARVGPGGIPTDILLLRRSYNMLFNCLPNSLVNWFCESMANNICDHEAYGLKPNHRYTWQHPTVHDELPNRILSGQIVVKGNIERFTEKGIVFEGEEEVTPIDDVIMATGYKIHFPFIDETIADFKDNKVELYKFAFPPDLPHPTLAFIGLFQPLGPGIPAGEIQCRWVTRIFNGKLKLPSRDDMWKDIRKRCEEIRKIFGASPCHTIHAYYINYMDEIAELIGCKPNFLRIMFTDPKLFYHCFFGPCLPYQYRLTGPGAWEGARDAILTYKERMYAPIQSKRVQTLKGQKGRRSMATIYAFLTIGLFFLLLAAFVF